MIIDWKTHRLRRWPTLKQHWLTVSCLLELGLHTAQQRKKTIYLKSKQLISFCLCRTVLRRLI